MRVLRVANGALLAALVVGAIVTYALKHQAEVAADDVAHLQASIAGEKAKLRALGAEWSFLSQPARLEAEVREHADYFQLQPFLPDQLAAISEIPIRTASAAPVNSAIAGTGAAPVGDAAVKATLARIAAGGALRAR